MESKAVKIDLEQYFQQFRNNIIGVDQTFVSPYGNKKIIYTDWTASGRLYTSIEEKMQQEFGPFIANTHTETTVTGTTMTLAYHEAQEIIKRHVNASKNDVLVSHGTGMTGVVNKFQRMLGLKIHENFKSSIQISENERPVVFVTHMEHHSNQTSWLETIAKVEIIQPDSNGDVDLNDLQRLINKYQGGRLMIASVTACSNVTGIQTDYHGIAKMMHRNNGLCFVDFACSAPYVNIDMHPEDKESYLDAIFFSPHKFLGGPGTGGILIFNKNLYKNSVPDCPGGGTVSWTNPWGNHKYVDNIENREDGGTPGFLQVIRTALCVKLKDKMGVENIIEREHELIDIIFNELTNVPNIHILEERHKERLGVISFYIDDLHYNLGVKLLNDKFGIQTRGGCSCAGTYGHYLLGVNQETSDALVCSIDSGDLIKKPGWIRMSIHPTTTNEEINFVCQSIKELASNFENWSKDYDYLSDKNEFIHHTVKGNEVQVKELFDI